MNIECSRVHIIAKVSTNSIAISFRNDRANLFCRVVSGKGHGGLCKAPTMEEKRKREAKKRERDQIKFIDLIFERWQVCRIE